jgi:hypothetical protein
MIKQLLNIIFLLVGFNCFALLPGDIMFVAWNADATDGFSIVTLTDIPATTTIYFNDNEWNGSAIGSGGAFISLTEYEMTWTSSGAVIPAGTIIDFNETSSTANPGYGAFISGVVNGTLTGEILNNASNEVLYAFLGTNDFTPTTFLTAIANDGFSAANGTLTNTGLTSGVNALSISGDEDLIEYRGIVCGDSAALRTALANSANFITEDGAGDQSNNGEPDFPHSVMLFSLNCCSPGGVSANINLWIKANDGPLNGVSSATNGQAVNTWQDLSGIRANDATDANLAPPTYRNNTTDNINFNPTIDFDGTNDGLDFGNDYIFTSGVGAEDGFTWFSVIEPDDPGVLKPKQVIIDFGQYANVAYGVHYGNSHYSTYTPNTLGGVYSGDIVHARSSQITLARFTIDLATNQTFNINGETTPSSNIPITIASLDATTINENSTHTFNNGPFTIGHQSKTSNLNSDNGRRLDGSISEIIGFSRDLTVNEIIRVESYLAIKYGITLNNTGGIAAGDYTISSGSLAWDASLNTLYHNDIAGLARDDKSCLDQRQSKSVNTDAIVTIGIDTITTLNTNHPTSFTTDSAVLIWGNNDSATSAWVTSEVQDGYNAIYRIKREWLVEENFGDIGKLKIQVDSANLPPPPLKINEPLFVVVDEDLDGDFSTGELRLVKLTKTNGVWETDINLADGEIFTFMHIHFDMMRHGKLFFNGKQQSYEWYDKL